MIDNPRDYLELARRMGAAKVTAACRGELKDLFARAKDGEVRTIWLQGTSDSGCTISLLEEIDPSLVDALLDLRRAVGFYPTLMGPSSDRALLALSHALAGKDPLDVLIVEGGGAASSLCPSPAASGRLVPFATWVENLNAVSENVVAIGACAVAAASAAGKPGPTILDVPGCPADPVRVVLSLATAIARQARMSDGLGPRLIPRRPEGSRPGPRTIFRTES